ncbi:MAG: polyprenol monophosphomannose synthase [Candidatus Magasanikbacteria bacterium]|nr:polyprenol monophosphomannose synthase [Candidatus Magasanikbacteria bacterium]
MFVSLIIPTYNEADNLPPLLAEIFEFLPRNLAVEIIIVDDNSPDGTGAVAEKLAAKYPITVIHRSGKLGLGSAVRAGLAAAKGDVLGVMDADLSHDPTILPQILSSLATNDIVIGSRFLPGSRVDDWPWWRRLISKVGVSLAGKITKVPAEDPLSGYFFLHRRVIAGVTLTTVGYKILFEILCQGNYATLKEIPFHFRKREHSQSKLNAREHLLFLKQLLTYARTPRS